MVVVVVVMIVMIGPIKFNKNLFFKKLKLVKVKVKAKAKCEIRKGKREVGFKIVK